MVPISYYLVLSGILFSCGVLGFLIKRNIITIFMSIELMLNAVNLSFIAFAAYLKALSGHVFVFFVMVVAASAQAVSEKAKKLQSSSIVVDTHDDTTQRLLDPTFDLAARQTDGNIDIPRMREGGLTAIFCCRLK